VVSRCFLAGDILCPGCWNPVACLRFLPPSFRAGLSQRCAHHKGCRNSTFTILPFIISNNYHIYGRTHTSEHTRAHTPKPRYIHTHTQKPTNKKKCSHVQKNTRLCFNGNNEVSMPLLEESRPKISPMRKPTQPCKAARKITLNPQPRAVQFSKRRQSGKRPVGDRADLVAAQPPAPASNRVSSSHRSPKITHTAQTPKPRKPPSRISPICPLPIRLPLVFVHA
jgi:hypothetical protein